MCETAPFADSLVGLIPVLAPRLSETQREHLVKLARNLEPLDARVTALAALAPYSPEDLPQEILTIARTTDDFDDKVQSLRVLAPHIKPEWWREWLRLAVDSARQVEGVSKDVLDDEARRGISERHSDPDRILTLFLVDVSPDIRLRCFGAAQ